MDDLTERALKLLREWPDLIEEAEDGAPIWNSIAGNLLAMETGCSRWATEKAVREALRLMKGPRARRPRWRDFETTAPSWRKFALSWRRSRTSTKESAAATNDHVPSAAPAPPNSRRFWNWKLIGGEIILTALGVDLFFGQAPRLSGMAGLVLGVLGVWLLLWEFRGFAVAPNAISFPSRFAKLPILTLRRISVSPASVRELTVLDPWLSIQMVEIYGGFGTELLLFQSRGQRLRFTSAVGEICPNVPLYRKKPLAKEYEA